MPKFRKKAAVIEAFQMTKERRWDNKDWPTWLNKAWNDPVGEMGAVWCVDGGEDLYIGTLNGPVKLHWDEWIVKGVENELYPCNPGIFVETYQSVEKKGEVPLQMVLSAAQMMVVAHTLCESANIGPPPAYNINFTYGPEMRRAVGEGVMKLMNKITIELRCEE